MTVRRALAVHLLVSFGLIALTYNATSQPWIDAVVRDEVAQSLVRRWLLWALALANLAGAFVVAAVPAPGRATFIVRHAALFLFVPLILLFVRSTSEVGAGHAGALYVALVAASAIHLLEGAWRAVPALGDRRIAALLGAIALAAFLAILPYHRTVQPTASDEPHYLLIVQSILYDGDVDLANDYAGDRYRVFYPDALPDVHGIHVGPAVYPIRDLGLPIVAALPFAAGGRSGVLALICLVGALLAAQLFLLARDLGLSQRVAFVAVALTAFTHPILTYTTQVYPDLGIALIFATIARLARRGRETSARDLAVASALAGLLPLLSTRAWLIAAPLALVVGLFAILGRATLVERARRAVAAGAPFLAIVAALAIANGLMFGLYVPSAGYYLISDQQQVLVYTPQVGGLGLFFDRVFGLVGRAPIYLLALLGAGALWARRRAHGAQLLVLAVGWATYFAYIASIAYWWADGSPPSRYLLGTIPFLVVALAAGVETLARVRRVALTAAALAALAWASAFVTYVYGVLPNLRYDLAVDIRARSGSGQLWDFLGRVIRPEPGDALPSLVTLDPASVALAAAWSAAGVVLVVAGLRLVRRDAPPRGPLA